ncbi:hypothetical protein H8356DRAFT_1357300 [Neocallimastix lanati (nom. inval.)]|nr:hypothetical protein H8356DRAFT_1357300 [Neocallimastix sp. JGI-2020a]
MKAFLRPVFNPTNKNEKSFGINKWATMYSISKESTYPYLGILFSNDLSLKPIIAFMELIPLPFKRYIIQINILLAKLRILLHFWVQTRLTQTNIKENDSDQNNKKKYHKKYYISKETQLKIRDENIKKYKEVIGFYWSNNGKHQRIKGTNYNIYKYIETRKLFKPILEYSQFNLGFLRSRSGLYCSVYRGDLPIISNSLGKKFFNTKSTEVVPIELRKSIINNTNIKQSSSAHRIYRKVILLKRIILYF